MGEASAAVRGVGKSAAASTAAANRTGTAWAGAAGLVARGAKVAGFAIAATFYEAIKMGVGFDQVLARIQTTTGASAKEVDMVRDHILHMRTVFKPQQLAESARYIEAIGNRGAKGMQILDAANEGAAISGANVVETSRTLAAIMRVQIPGALGSARDVMAEVNAVVGTGAITLDEFNHAMGQGVLPVAKRYGLTFQDVAAALAVFTDEHIKGSSAMAQFATGLHFLIGGSSKAQKALRTLGLSGRQVGVMVRGPNGLLTAATAIDEALNKKFGTTPLGLVKASEVINNIFPAGRGRILQVLLNQMNVYQQKLSQQKKIVGEFNADIAATHATAANQIGASWGHLQQQLILLYDNIKKPGVAAIMAILKVATKFIDILTAITDHSKALKNIIVPLGMAFLVWKGYMTGAAIAEAVLTGEGIVAAFIAAAAATDIWTASMIALDAALWSNPVVLVGLAIAALAAAIVIIIMHWKDMKNAAVDAWHWIENAAVNTWGFIKSHWALLLGILLGPFTLARILIIRHFDGIVNFFKGLPARIANAVSGLFMGVVHEFERMANAIKNKYNKLPGPLRHIIGTFGNIFTYPTRFLVNAAHGRVAIPYTPLGGGGSAKFPGAASGADIMRGGALWVGERGPELVELPEGARVNPLKPNFGAQGTKGDIGMTDFLSRLAHSSRRPIANNIYMDGKLFYRVMSQYAADGRARA